MDCGECEDALHSLGYRADNSQGGVFRIKICALLHNSCETKTRTI